MRIMAKLDIISTTPPDIFKHLQGIPDILVRIKVNTGLRMGRRKVFYLLAPISAPLDTEVTNPLFFIFLDILYDSFQRTRITVTVHCHTFPAFASQKLIHRHIGHFAFDIPKGHIHSRKSIIGYRAVSPKGVKI